MTWTRMYALGYFASFENKDRNEIILVGKINNKIDVTVNHNQIGSVDTQDQAKEIVTDYMRRNP